MPKVTVESLNKKAKNIHRHAHVTTGRGYGEKPGIHLYIGPKHQWRTETKEQMSEYLDMATGYLEKQGGKMK